MSLRKKGGGKSEPGNSYFTGAHANIIVVISKAERPLPNLVFLNRAPMLVFGPGQFFVS